jgi:hypothetical protein
MIRKAVSVIMGAIFLGVTLIAVFGNGFSWHGDDEISNHQNMMEKNRVKNATETESIGIEQIGSQMTIFTDGKPEIEFLNITCFDDTAPNTSKTCQENLKNAYDSYYHNKGVETKFD